MRSGEETIREERRRLERIGKGEEMLKIIRLLKSMITVKVSKIAIFVSKTRMTTVE